MAPGKLLSAKIVWFRGKELLDVCPGRVVVDQLGSAGGAGESESSDAGGSGSVASALGRDVVGVGVV